MKKSLRKKAPTRGRSVPRPSSSAQGSSSHVFPIVGIGASAGGLEAFSDLLRHLPEKTGMAFVLVQHLDPTHGSVLPEILARKTAIPVEEVSDGVHVLPDHIYVIPANSNMLLEDGVLRLSARMVVRGQHMPIDAFFQSLANERGALAIGVILSGTASDGTEGCTAIKVAGGITFAQDEASAKYTSMPHSAVSAGCIDFVASPKDIAKELTRIGQHPYVATALVKPEEASEIASGRELHTLLSLLRDASGVEFTTYKQSTLQRRIKRRMVLHHLEELKDYVRYIRSNPTELDALYSEILIHVTGFFRDPEAFNVLRTTVFPRLFKDRKPDDGPVRIWIPGCSTGEEVFSIAIAVNEYIWEEARNLKVAFAGAKTVQIFATDISDISLDRARSGLYTEAAIADISAERLKRFFVKLEKGYQVDKPLREMCIFAKQNIAKDPPFSNLDLISCRNLLIYLGPVLQKRVIPTLHYALKPNGYLMLGGSESLGAFSDHFTLVDKKYKIYQKKQTATPLITYFAGVDYSFRKPQTSRPQRMPTTEGPMEREVDRVLANRFIPASIVVNDEMEIVQFRGRTGAYLEPAAGHPTFSLSRMAREGLLVDLRSALTKAKKDDAVVRRERVTVKSNGGTREVNLEVIPIRGQGSPERFYIVVFQDAKNQAAHRVTRKTADGAEQAKDAPLGRENERLHREISQLREQLQALIEDHQSTAEEYKSANEEVLSTNEELQSTNEELETAKEELQSSNEELTTVNEELQNRNSELSLANNDLMNLFGNVNIPVVMVGNDLRIRRFTSPAQKLLNLIPADIGRRLGQIRPNADLDDLEQIVQNTIDSTVLHEREVREKDGTWHLMRVRPYKTAENKIEGAVIAFQDIDALKRSLEQSRHYADTLIESAREAILVLDQDLRVSVANSSFYHKFEVSKEDTEGQLVFELGNRQWDIPKLRELLGNISGQNTRVDDFEVQHDFPNLGPRTMLLNARRMEPQLGGYMIFLAIEDITDKKKQLEELKLHAAMIEMANETVLVRDLEGTIYFWNRGAEEMYGWSKDEALGKSIPELLQSQYPVPFDEIREELLRNGRWEGELVHVRRDGEKRIVNSRWALQKDDQGNYLVLEINSDITGRKQSEENLRQLSGYLMRVQDEERRRIARELHDSTGQKLVAAKLSLEAIAKDGKSKGAPARESLAQTIKLVDEITSEIRTVAQLLHPPLLDEAGLISATRWLVDGFSNRSKILVDLALPLDIGRLPENVEIALFRVIQESLNNVHRHSGAKKATIELRRNAEHVTLEISDNGKGLPVGLLSETGQTRPFGVGILGMKERLAQLGGWLEVTSSKKGTTIKAVVPAQ
jgi:two-component system, chemotaxis family, CheB/CheR fusion protein